MKKFLSMILALMMVLSLTTIAWGEETSNVAKVGNKEYATIDEAIAAWTNGTTLTLLADVTLSDVINLSSTEYHVLNLGTCTMTAASSKDAIQIVNNGRSSASWALDINADATNPGGITATGKAIVRTAGKSGVKDRPIIRFYNGVFNASNIVYHSGSNGTNCPQFQFHGGTFNGTISTNRTLNQFYGGTFNGSLMMSVDSSAYTLIAGGTFKQLSNLYMSALNIDKFTIGSTKGEYDREVYINDEGYYVVATANPAEGFEAAVAKTPGTNDYLKYSKVAVEEALNYTDVYMALEKNNTASDKVTVYVDKLDMAGIDYKGTIVVPEGKTLTITNAPAGLKTEGNVTIESYASFFVDFNANGGTGTMDSVTVNAGNKYTLPANSFSAPVGKQFKGWATSADGSVIESTTYTVTEPVTFYARWDPLTYTIAFNSDGGSDIEEQTVVYGGTANKPADSTKSGYTFGGWYTDADCTMAFDFATEITNATTLYAQWELIPYTITYSNVDSHSNPTTYTVESDTITLAAPAARTGYTFAGWYAKNDFSDTAVTEIATGSTGDKVYYAKWTPNTYTVAFNANSGDGTMADLSFTYGTAQHLTTNAFTRVGYNFAGWATSAGGAVAYANGASVSNLTAENNGAVTLYAVWTKIPPAPVYPSMDTPAFDPDEDVDVEDNTLNDAALAVGGAIENGDVKMEPAAGYTVEEITKLQNEGKLNLVIQKKLSYDTTEKSLIDAAITKVGGSASQVDVVYIDVTPVLMTDDGTVVASITDTEKPLTITLDLSAEMQKAAEEGKFISVIRVHDGKVTFLDSKLNAEKTKITFTSSEFSTYAVVAMDKDPSANTFDAGIAMYSVMALLAATGSAVIIKKRK